MEFLAFTIRKEAAGDEIAIRSVHRGAFPGFQEGQLVDDLRRAGRLTISLVAETKGQIVGHVTFSPVTVGESNTGLGLAPLAVLPSFQRQRIGSALAREGLAECAKVGAHFVVVLGSPVYYGRFGFKPAKYWNLVDEFDGREAFQAIEIIAGSIPAGGGLVKYAPEFSAFLP